MQVETFQIQERFRGPPRSGNGGYTCGRIAAYLPGTVAVRLKAPPPLDAELRLESDDDQARLFHGDTCIGEARLAQLDLRPPPAPSFEQAQAASRHFLGFHDHPFPGCFVCGPQRQGEDGLCIFAGPVDGGPTIAAPWIPDPSLADGTGKVRAEYLWAALDCTGAFALFPRPEGSAIVLGELTASILGEVKPGEQCVVTGWPAGDEGRKHFAGTAIHAPGGRLVAIARAVWVDVPRSSWA